MAAIAGSSRLEILERIANDLPVPPGDLHFEYAVLPDLGPLHYAWGRGVDDKDGHNCFFAVWHSENCPVGGRLAFEHPSPTKDICREYIQTRAAEDLAEFKKRGMTDPSWWKGDARVNGKEYLTK